MQHRFDTEIAKQYDIVTAILLDNFYFWIKQNEVNERNFKDGRYWTYNSKKAIAEWFPYLNERQLDYALKKMVEQGLIIKGNYNENKYDRTLWYAITDFGYSILQNCKMYDNGYNINFSITTTNTSTNTDIEKKSKRKNEKYEEEFEEIWKLYPRKKGKSSALSHYIKARKEGVSYEVIKQGVENYAKECKVKGRSEEYIKHGSTWFNSKSWLDDYDVNGLNCKSQNEDRPGWC